MRFQIGLQVISISLIIPIISGDIDKFSSIGGVSGWRERFPGTPRPGFPAELEPPGPIRTRSCRFLSIEIISIDLISNANLADRIDLERTNK